MLLESALRRQRVGQQWKVRAPERIWPIVSSHFGVPKKLRDLAQLKTRGPKAIQPWWDNGTPALLRFLKKYGHLYYLPMLEIGLIDEV